MNQSDVKAAIQSGNVYITKHANEEAGNDRLTFAEVFDSVFVGEIIEDYPLDPRGPSCLIYGHNKNEDPIHSVWALKQAGVVVLITVYRPDPDLWIDYRQRKKQ